MISNQKFIDTANQLGIEVAVIKAVAEVESNGAGFLSTGEPVILFEPHVFWRQLVSKFLKPYDYVKGNEDILYPKWGSKPYGKSSQQHSRLARAAKIHREAALESCSWGKFQIMGYHWKSLGYKSLQDFINKMYRSEEDHLDSFVRFITVNNLVKYLKTRNWEAFALRYNGQGYKVNKYDTKMEKAYLKYKKQ